MIDFVNAMIKDLAALAVSLLSLLPDSPFQWITGALGDYLAIINYFFPISAIVAEMPAYLTVVGLWYVVRWLLQIIRYAG